MYKICKGKIEIKICHYCSISFEIPARFAKRKQKLNPNWNFYCSRKCRGLNQSLTKTFLTNCKTCGNNLLVKNSVKTKAIKNGNNGENYFCNTSCAGKYNTTHKTKGIRRSKLEVYCYNRIINDFPQLLVNKPNELINYYELDIYIPFINLAFELQGIFHREPIYGQVKLESILARDLSKSNMCKWAGINLYAIQDTMAHFTEKKAEEFFDKNILPLLPIQFVDGLISDF